MTTKPKETTNAETKEETKKEYANVISVVTKVMTPKQSDDRITIVLRDSDSFETIKFETGEIEITNMFGINIFNLVSQVGSSISYIQMADALSMGAMVNPQIISLCMLNAEIEIERTFKKKGEKREGVNGVYEKDCITTKIVKIKPHISPEFVPMIQMLLTTKPFIVKTTQMTPNPFNM